MRRFKAHDLHGKLIRFLLYSYKKILIDFLNFKIKLIKGEFYVGTKWI